MIESRKEVESKFGRKMIIAKQSQKAYIAATIYAVIVGLSFLFSKIALASAPAIDVLLYRFLTSFVALSIPVFLGVIPLDLSWTRLKRLLPLACLYPLAFFALQTFGLIYATSSEGGIIQAAAPVFIMFMAQYFLGEKLNRRQRLAVFCSFLGVLYILFKTGSSLDLANLRGILLLLGSVLSFSIYNILTRKLVRDYTNWELSYATLSLSFLSFGIFALIKHGVNGSFASLLLPLQKPSFIFAILYLGILSTLGTSILNNFALAHLEASRVSVFGYLGTVISMLAGVLFLQETLAYYHILGSVLIIGGVIETNRVKGPIPLTETKETDPPA